MASNEPSSVQQIIARSDWRQRLVSDYEATADRLLSAYQNILPRLRDAAGALNNRISEWDAANPDGRMSAGDVQGFGEYGALLRRVQAETQDFARLIRNESGGLQDRAIPLGTQAGQDLAVQLSGNLSQIIQTQWNRPAPETLRQLIDYVDGAAFRDKISSFGENAAENAADTILAAVAQGKNPRTIATILNNWFAIPYTWGDNMVSTAQLYSYRAANHASFTANQNLLNGWVWIASLDTRVCFPKGTLIQTDKGLRFIEDIKVGDKVLTNTGVYRRVAETIRRPYSGAANTILRDDQRITMTADHPILVERFGIRHWVAAKDVRVGDRVFVNADNQPDNLNHRGSDIAVKGGIRNTDRAKSLFNKALHLSLIGLRSPMPINTIDLNNKIAGGDEEINRVAAKSSLLDKLFSKFVKTQPEASLWLRFGIRFSIARWTAILLARQNRHNAELRPTGKTSINYRRAATFFRTVKIPFPMLGKFLTATFAGNISRIRSFAGSAASRVAVSVGDRNTEVFATDGAGFSDTVALNAFITQPAAKLSRSCALISERLAAFLANSINPFILHRIVARPAAIPSTTFSNPGSRDTESLSTMVAGSFNHSTIISNVAHHIQSEVYNLEVEIDHTYVANGLLVHNCMSCVSQHGTVFPVTKTLNDHHKGRCAPAPWVKGTSWPELMITGPNWFESQSAATQRNMMGGALYNAWKSGAMQWPDMSQPYQDDVYGEMLREASVSGALGRDEAQKYYVRNQ